MATVTPFIRTTKKEALVNVRFRVSDGRISEKKVKQIFYKSDIKVNSEFWDKKRFGIKPNIGETTYKAADKVIFNTIVAERKKVVENAYLGLKSKGEVTSDLLELEIDKILSPEKYKPIDESKNFFDVFERFLIKNKLSTGRKNHYKVVIRALRRFEIYKTETKKKSFVLELDELDVNTLRDFETFLKNEHRIIEKYPNIHKEVDESRTPKERGQNTIHGIFTKLRAFIKWCIKEEYTTNNPFVKFIIPKESYGTPYFITIDERNHLYNFDLSHRPQLAIQRDIFVFQCVIGCRVGDLLKMTVSNLVNDAIEYIPRKTIDGKPMNVRVPLNSIAKEILNRYPENENNKLLPFISSTNYNLAIKEFFTIAGLNRLVTILNPTTGEPDSKPLNEIVSSHVARRCFIGNLYEKVQDPNLIGKLSGHVEGSKAFARYRDVSEKMKTDLVKMLE